MEMRRGSGTSSREQRHNQGENQGLEVCLEKLPNLRAKTQPRREPGARGVPGETFKPKSKDNKIERSRAEKHRAVRESQRA